MELKLIRKIFADQYTQGELFVDGEFNCHTLEDCDRHLEEGNEKIHGQTAIPIGTYDVVIDKSVRFCRLMPHVLNVKGFDGIRIHSGNTADDTEGCILVGLHAGKGTVLESRLAFVPLFNRMLEATRKGEKLSIVIVRDE